MKRITVELPSGLTKEALTTLAKCEMPDLHKYEGPTCTECLHWDENENAQADDGTIIGPHCDLFSCECATAVFNRKTRPPWFIKKEKPKCKIENP